MLVSQTKCNRGGGSGGGGDYGPPYLEDIEKRTEILSGAKETSRAK